MTCSQTRSSIQGGLYYSANGKRCQSFQQTRKHRNTAIHCLGKTETARSLNRIDTTAEIHPLPVEAGRKALKGSHVTFKTKNYHNFAFSNDGFSLCNAEFSLCNAEFSLCNAEFSSCNTVLFLQRRFLFLQR